MYQVSFLLPLTTNHGIQFLLGPLVASVFAIGYNFEGSHVAGDWAQMEGLRKPLFSGFRKSSSLPSPGSRLQEII